MSDRISKAASGLNKTAKYVLAGLLFTGVSAQAIAQPSPARSSEAEQSSLSRNLPPNPNVDDAASEAYLRALRVYEEEVRDFQTTIGQIINSEYRSRRSRIDNYFRGEIETLRVEERARRGRAIREFERFLTRYPNHEVHTPDVLFRLAELHYEKTEDDFLVADLAWEEQRRRYDVGLIPELPEEPEKDFSRSIELFERLVTQFPDYRQVDGAWYLLGICYLQMYENEQAMESFQTLVYNYPDSQFAQEGFLRLGEEFFGIQDFRMARPAYERALVYGDSVWYDKIIFKLGWANYMLNEYDRAIGNFTDLLEYYAERQGRSDQAVREEALQYFAIVLGEQDWDLDGQTDREFILPRVQRYLKEDRPYTLEVLDRLSTILAEYAEGGGADFYSSAQIDVLRHAVDRFPLDPQTAERHNEIITALFRADKIQEALAEGDRFTEAYSVGSAWYSEQERLGNFEEIAYAERVSRVLLIEAGTILYTEAEALMARSVTEREPGLVRDAQTRYLAAAAAFAQFVKNYPNDLEVYEVQMYRAQALLNGGRLVEAADVFADVRESTLSTEYRDVAAGLAIDAYAQALTEAIDAGRLEHRAWPPYASLRDISVVDAATTAVDSDLARSAPANEPIPELTLKWVSAVDRYVELDLNVEDEPTTQGAFAYAAARVFYDYRHYDAAIERLTQVIRKYCGQTETGFSVALLLDIYKTREDYSQIEFWTNEVARLGECVRVPDELVAAFNEDLERFRMGAVADQAERLYAEGRYEEAAVEYARLTRDYADSDFAPLGLYNAGLIYEEDLREYRLAMESFEELIARYPNSEYVDEALVRIAVNSTNFFDFEKAIDTYLLLDRKKYSNRERNLEFPLLTAAELMRYTQRYDEAARAFLRFASDNSRNPRAPAAVYTAAMIYDAAGNHAEMSRIFARYRSNFGTVSNALIDGNLAIVSSYVRELEIARQDRDRRKIESLEARVLQEFERRRPTPTPSSWSHVQYAVGEILFERAKKKYEEWDAVGFGTTTRTQQERIAARVAAMPTLRDELNGVIIAGSADWTICAKYYQGMIYKRMSDRVAGMPAPDFRTMEEEDMYYSGSADGSWPGVDAIIRQWEDQAIKDWVEDGYPVAVRTGVFNECARSMLSQLNRVRPDEYPVFRTEIREDSRMLYSPSALVSPPARLVQGAAALGDRPSTGNSPNESTEETAPANGEEGQ